METNKRSKLSILVHLLIYLTILLNFLPSITLAFESKKIIAITEIVDHPSLAEAKKGIIDELENNGFIIGKNLEVIDKSAGGSIATSILIAKQFVGQRPDVIVPISTPSAQSVISVLKNQNQNIPVVFSSVTDPISAGIITSQDTPMENVTGAMDFPLIEEEIELIKNLTPNSKKIGLLYSSGEANSVKTINLMKIELAKSNIEYIEANVINSGQATQGFLSLVGKVDVVYIPSDNVIFSAMANLVKLSHKHKLPLFSNDPDSVKAGVTACLGYSQYMVGRTAGELIAQVLSGKHYLKVRKPEKAEIHMNKKSCEIIGINTATKLKSYSGEIFIW